MVLFIGPTKLSGIGQVVHKYSLLYPGSACVEYGHPVDKDESVFIFALPIPDVINYIVHSVQAKTRNIVCMTVCETETVHEVYGHLVKLFPTVYVPSEFCQVVLSRQFPETRFEVIRHHVPLFKVPKNKDTSTYIFYHIGNVMDQRKQTKKIIEAFMRLNKPDTLLVLKATCKEPVHWKLPRVHVINGLISEEQMLAIHERCHCYVSFSHSEGVGMGAVEAAMCDKPVIITEYSAPKEYIKTPYMIKCGTCELPHDDFLFQKGMVWGEPDFNQLLQCMKDAYDERLTKMDHSSTRTLVSAEAVRAQLDTALGLAPSPVL
jgi:glycosyltransferase involved in cell wall biosynthesis